MDSMCAPTRMSVLPHLDLDKINFWSQIAFAFGDLELGAVLAGEVRDPTRNVPRAAWISGKAIAALYVLGTIAMLLPPERISILTGLVKAANEIGARPHAAWLGNAIVLLILAGVADSSPRGLSAARVFPS